MKIVYNALVGLSSTSSHCLDKITETVNQLKSWNVSGASTMIWSIDNLLNQNLTLGLFRLNTSRPSYSQSNLFCSKWAKELARLRSRPF